MERVVAAHGVAGATRKAVTRPILIAGSALIVAVLLLYISPPGAFGRGGVFSSLSRLPSASAGPAESRLEGLEARVTPPAYTGERSTTLRDPSSIAALSGSTISIHGNGSAAGLTASLANPLRVVEGNDGWTVSLAMPTSPAALELRDRGYERLIVLAPIADAPPKVVLTSPVHDTALRTDRKSVV